jgi:hypothetical protein
MVSKHLYIWKSSTTPDEVAIGEIALDRFGEPQRHEHLSLHVDAMLDLFGADVYHRVADMTPDDEPIPLTLSLDIDADAPRAGRYSLQAPSAAQRNSAANARRRA